MWRSEGDASRIADALRTALPSVTQRIALWAIMTETRFIFLEQPDLPRFQKNKSTFFGKHDIGDEYEIGTL